MGQTQPGDVLRRRRGLRGTEVRTGETVYNRTKGGVGSQYTDCSKAHGPLAYRLAHGLAASTRTHGGMTHGSKKGGGASTRTPRAHGLDTTQRYAERSKEQPRRHGAEAQRHGDEKERLLLFYF